MLAIKAKIFDAKAQRNTEFVVRLRRTTIKNSAPLRQMLFAQLDFPEGQTYPLEQFEFNWHF